MTLRGVCSPIHNGLSEVEEKLKKRTNHTINIFANGKRLRPVLMLYAAHAFGKTRLRDVTTAATAIEMIHTASLIHDDVVDGSIERRNKPALHTSLGTRSAVILGDFLFAQGLAMIESVKTANITPLVVRVVEAMCEGQWMEMANRRQNDYSEKEYLDVIEKKTVSLFSCCCKIGGILRGAGECEQELLCDFGRCFGFTYQLLDDAADLSADGCGRAEQRIIEWGGKDYCEQLARDYTQKARSVISRLSNEIEKKGFEQILSYIWR